MVRSAGHKSAAVMVLLVGGALFSCGGNPHSIPAPTIPNVAGPWEFIAISNSGAVTGIDVALAEGQILLGGISQPNGQITASSAQIAFVSLSPNTLNITGFGGACQPATSQNALSGAVTTVESPLQFSFTENGSVFNVTATLSGDGKSVLNGTYTAQAGNSCTADTGGTISGNALSKITGTYTGHLCALNDTSSPCQQVDTASAVASESSSSTITMNLTLSGSDNTTLTLSGPVTGNAFVLQGTVQGQVVTYYGYSEAINSVSSLYLVNATNPTAPNYVGTLAVPH